MFSSLIRMFVRSAEAKAVEAPKPPKPEKTIVFLRAHKIPAKFWESEVYYDAWGSPYVKGDGYSDWIENPLKPNGKTHDTIGQTEWRHKSGPPVTFGDRPRTPFPNQPFKECGCRCHD